MNTSGRRTPTAAGRCCATGPHHTTFDWQPASPRQTRAWPCGCALRRDATRCTRFNCRRAEYPFAIVDAALWRRPCRVRDLEPHTHHQPRLRRNRPVRPSSGRRRRRAGVGRWSINGSSTSSGCGARSDRGPRRINSAGRPRSPAPTIASPRGSSVRATPADEWEATSERPFAITASTSAPAPPPASHVHAVASVALTTNVPAPQPAGSTIVWTATPTGGAGALVYKWFVYELGLWRPDGIVDRVESIQLDAHEAERELSRLRVGQAREQCRGRMGSDHRNSRSRSPSRRPHPHPHPRRRRHAWPASP